MKVTREIVVRYLQSFYGPGRPWSLAEQEQAERALNAVLADAPELGSWAAHASAQALRAEALGRRLAAAEARAEAAEAKLARIREWLGGWDGIFATELEAILAD